MKDNNLLKTNLLISFILIIGFALTAVFSYQANYQASLDNIEQVSSLTAEGIYYQITTRFTKPVNISLTMSHDSLLMDHLSEEKERLEDQSYVETIRNYLETYRKKYGFDSVFLVSTASSRYYNFNGIDRVLAMEDAENQWYYDFLESDQEYFLNVDNDEVAGADNDITVFVNCKIIDADKNVLGVVGIGIRIDHLKELLKGYEEKFDLEASLISTDGQIQISTTHTGYEKMDWFETNGHEDIREKVLRWEENEKNQEFWSASDLKNSDKSYVVSRFIPELSWHLVVEQDTGQIIQEMRKQMYRTILLLMIVILTVLIVITTVIRKFNKQITVLIEERQEAFKRATEQMYDNIYEFNITKNCYEGKRTEQYFASLGAEGVCYDKGLQVIARKQIKKEYRDGYISMFSPENVIREYQNGNDHLRYDFKITIDGDTYHWMRIDAYIFKSNEDGSLHMFTYRKNIEQEKQKEIQAVTDEMTGLYTKGVTERLIEKRLSENPGSMYAFFILDIDNFKQVNDHCGHAFGDHCIKEFTRIMKVNFEKDDILGRIGGDEFVAFVEIPDEKWAEDKVKELSKTLDFVCADTVLEWRLSASIGVSLSIDGLSDFKCLYRKADTALYMTKQKGKNGYTVI